MKTIHVGGLIYPLFFGFSIAAAAQQTVSGTVTDQMQTPADAAVIALLDASNGQTIKQTITDSNGKFSINTVENEVKIYVSCIGYTHYLSQPITLKGDTVLPVIVLKEELAQIENVVIVGERQPSTIKMELNASYLSHRLGASNEYMKPSGYVDLYLNKSFLGKRIMVSMAITDIFHTNRCDNHSSFSGFELWNWGKGESRQIRLNVCYKFGKQHANAHRSNFNEIERL